MSERDEKRGGLGCAITGIVLILLPVLYVLSIGPAAWLDDRSPGGIYVLRAAYAPLLSGAGAASAASSVTAPHDCSISAGSGTSLICRIGEGRRKAIPRSAPPAPTQIVLWTPIVVGGDVAVWFGELDEPETEGQLRVRALDPELVWLAHEHKPWQPRHEA